MLEIIKKNIYASNHTKCVSLRNPMCFVKQFILFLLIYVLMNAAKNFYYPFLVKLARCIGSCNTVNDLSNKICIPSKTGDLDLSVCNMITGTNESKTLTRHISCECNCKFDGTKCNSNQWQNNDKCRCECKKVHVCENDNVWNPTKCNCENEKYLSSIVDDPGIICDEIIDVKKNEF